MRGGVEGDWFVAGAKASGIESLRIHRWSVHSPRTPECPYLPDRSSLGYLHPAILPQPVG